MGLIKAAVASASSTLADQWLEYFYCDSLSNNELIKKGVKVVSKGSNTKGSENIISNGTGIAINEGQGVIIVEDGKIVEFSVEPGRFTWDSSSEPSLFDSGWKGLKESFATFGKRFTMGGTPGKDQRVYFVNLKEIFDNKFGTASPMAYKDPTYRGIYIRYYGQYTFKIEDPIKFYTNVAGNVSNTYTKDEFDSQSKAEFVNALDTTIAKLADENVQYNDIPKKQMELAKYMNDALDEEWNDKRGIVISSVAIEKVTPDDESRKRIEDIDDAIMYSDKRVAAGRLVDAQASAMEKAASNEAGAMQGFMGYGMANQAGNNIAGMFDDQTQTATPSAASSQGTTWTCPKDGTVNTGKFCSECGTPKPSDGTWTCPNDGTVNTGKFCSECGKPKE